jgi:SAM-dependent methyltransferase
MSLRAVNARPSKKVADSARHCCSWEQAVTTLLEHAEHRQLMFDAYLTADLLENCRRFALGAEFREVLRLIAEYAKSARLVLDIPGGNGIAAFAFSQAGFDVTSVEPDASDLVGRGAIRHVLKLGNLSGHIVGAYGERLPFADNTFDVIYVRQGLHHASNLGLMVKEYARVAKPRGLLLACREPVVDDHGASLQEFLDSQVDHQVYGGENAFTLAEYRAAIRNGGFELVVEIRPYSNPINLYPHTDQSLATKILASPPGRVLRFVCPKALVIFLARMYLRYARRPGRLYTFIALKSK